MPTSKTPEPVRIYIEDDARLPTTIEKVLREARDNLISGLADGSAKDFADYRDKTGEIRGLNVAISICQNARKQLSEH